MSMTIKEVLTNYKLIKEILLQRGLKEMPKSLKTKIMKAIIDYGQIKKRFEEDIKNYTEYIISDELRDLGKKENRSEAEEFRYQDLTSQVNLNYKNYLADKEKEEVFLSESFVEKFMTFEEYEELVDINSMVSVEFNGSMLRTTDFLELIYEHFVIGE